MGSIANSGVADRPFHIDPARSFTLPARYYTSAEVHAQERSAIFARSWFYVGHQSQIADPGAYLTAMVGDQELIVIRGDSDDDDAGEIRAFHNVCKHRGHQLLVGAGTARVIVCPYHAWVYGTDGSLRQARNTDEMIDFAPGDFGLSPVRVELLCGFMFVCLDEQAESLDDQASGLADEMRAYCPEIDSLEFVQRDRYEVACNWKTIVDNFLECYHCATAHRNFVDLVDMKSYRSKIKGIYSSHISNDARTTDSSAYTFEPGTVDFGYAAWFLWPNVTFWIYPGDANVSVLQMLPTATEVTVEYQDWFCPNGRASDQLRDAMDYQRDVLQPEDVSLCESVQRGLHSLGYNQGRFVIDRDRTELSEHTVHHFQHMVAESLGVPIEAG